MIISPSESEPPQSTSEARAKPAGKEEEEKGLEIGGDFWCADTSPHNSGGESREREERDAQDESPLLDAAFFEPPPAVDAGAQVLAVSNSSFFWSSISFSHVGFESDIAKPKMPKGFDRAGGHSVWRRALKAEMATHGIN